jgi:hypothetical protein
MFASNTGLSRRRALEPAVIIRAAWIDGEQDVPGFSPCQLLYEIIFIFLLTP